MTELEADPPRFGHLVGVSQMLGATAYNVALEDLGSIGDVLIDTSRHRIAFVVIASGGLLGIGDHFYPVPPEMLRYNEEMGGYIVDIDKAAMEGAPSYTRHAPAAWDDAAWRRGIYAYYAVTPYWEAGD